MQKRKFLENIRNARKGFEEEISRFSPEMMQVPGIDGNWSVKDIIAHIGWYEEQMVNLLKLRALQGSELWELDLEERNSAIYSITQDEDLDIVLKKENEIYQTMLEFLQSMDESSLNDSRAFTGMPEDWEPWNVIASNTYEHYLDHLEELRRIPSKKSEFIKLNSQE